MTSKHKADKGAVEGVVSEIGDGESFGQDKGLPIQDSVAERVHQLNVSFSTSTMLSELTKKLLTSLQSEKPPEGKLKLLMAHTALLRDYLPLLRDCLPQAAADLEHDLSSTTPVEADDYVYDVYAMDEGFGDHEGGEDTFYPTMVQIIHDERFEMGEDIKLEYDSQDSNDYRIPADRPTISNHELLFPSFRGLANALYKWRTTIGRRSTSWRLLEQITSSSTSAFKRMSLMVIPAMFTNTTGWSETLECSLVVSLTDPHRWPVQFLLPVTWHDDGSEDEARSCGYGWARFFGQNRIGLEDVLIFGIVDRSTLIVSKYPRCPKPSFMKKMKPCHKPGLSCGKLVCVHPFC